MTAKPLCAVTDIPESGSLGLETDTDSLFAVRRGDQVYLYRNSCPHEFIPLNHEPDDFMDDSGTLIECVNHGALLTIETGECVAGPCIGDCLDAVDCTVKHGQLYLNE